jgi:hypothetical protein
MTETVTAFLEDRQLVSGERDAVTAFLLANCPDDLAAVRVHDDSSGRVIDFDFRETGSEPRGRGRPSLGVTPREVTLLPRHWDWLASQRGGASATIRRLVDEARAKARTARQRQDAAYAFMQASCGDRSGYEEALRALYRGEVGAFAERIADWPEDVRAYIARLLADD